jgi:large subunit ribosomal protein L17
MAASFYISERVITTKEKAKELKRITEKLITRARRNLELPENEVGKKLHNIRIVMKYIKNREAVQKLFDDIAKRYLNRKGGYTRIFLLGRRNGDAAEMAILELVEKKQKEVKIKDQDKDKEKAKSKKEGKKEKKEK